MKIKLERVALNTVYYMYLLKNTLSAFFNKAINYPEDNLVGY